VRVAGSGAELPPWRRTVLPAVMTLLRLLVVMLLTRAELRALLADQGVLAGRMAAATRYGLAAGIVVGAILFVLPRTVAAGALVLALALGLFEYLWRRLDLPPGHVYGYALALLIVLAVSDWMVRRVQAKVYSPKTPP
jgi:hypothetical protein